MTKKQDNSRNLTAVLPNDVEQVQSGVRKFQKWLKTNFSAIRRTITYLLLTTLTLTAIFLMFFFVDLLDTYESLQEQRAEVSVQYEYWENAAVAQPNSPDVLYYAAVSAYRVGKTETALEYINRVLFLDPQFTKAYELKKKIEE